VASVIDLADLGTHRKRRPALPGEDRLFRALVELRAADTEPRRHMHAEWLYLGAWFTGEAGRRPGARDACQFALMRVSRSIMTLRAQSPSEATSWLRRVLRTGFCDVHRTTKNEPVAAALKTLTAEERDRTLRLLAAPEPPVVLIPEALDGWLDVVMDEVDDWLEANVPSLIKRAGDRRRAEVALLRHVRKVSLDDLRTRLGEVVARDTLYKWFERGRDEVLTPTLSAWASRGGLKEDEVAFITELRSILIATRREKSRKPRKSVS